MYSCYRYSSPLSPVLQSPEYGDGVGGASYPKRRVHRGSTVPEPPPTGPEWVPTHRPCTHVLDHPLPYPLSGVFLVSVVLLVSRGRVLSYDPVSGFPDSDCLADGTPPGARRTGRNDDWWKGDRGVRSLRG